MVAADKRAEAKIEKLKHEMNLLVNEIERLRNELSTKTNNNNN
jgi:hypothetical protein